MVNKLEWNVPSIGLNWMAAKKNSTLCCAVVIIRKVQCRSVVVIFYSWKPARNQDNPPKSCRLRYLGVYILLCVGANFLRADCRGCPRVFWGSGPKQSVAVSLLIEWKGELTTSCTFFLACIANRISNLAICMYVTGMCLNPKLLMVLDQPDHQPDQAQVDRC